MTTPLAGLVVVDLSSGIAGGYCTKALVDGGAEVVKVEGPGGDALRGLEWATSAGEGLDSGLFEFLGCSKRSVVVAPHDAADLALARTLLRAADIVVWSPGSEVADLDEFKPVAIRALAPAAIVASITPFGLDGPWSGRAANELTLQAWSGGISGRGDPRWPPVHCGGQPGQWLAGITAAVGILTAHYRSAAVGVGELVDVSVLDTLTLMLQMYPVTIRTARESQGLPAPLTPTRSIGIPAIEAGLDGWVGFMVATAWMWESFCVLVEHPEWLDDSSLYSYAGRQQRREEIETATREWVGERTVEEVLENAAALRVPVAPVGNGQNVTDFDHFRSRGFYLANPAGRFLQPDVPYTLGKSDGRRPPTAAPRLGAHTDSERGNRRPARTRSGARRARALPFSGLRVADFTAFWAGPIVGHYLAMMGAEVIHVESPRHPDGIRGHSIKSTADERWWEYTPMFHGPNTNKRGVTIDMGTDRGRQVARRLISACDIMLENYSPRVMEQWGLEYEAVRHIRPDIIFVRMPAFGLRGPWKERTGYAQTMEQVSGMAWVTGFPEGPPHVPNGACDPLAGTHATFALLLALEHRRRTGEGMQVEVAMVGGALNVAAQQAIEYQTSGRLIERTGNHGLGVPHNLYRVRGVDRFGRPDCWVAIAVETDEQWLDLCEAIGQDCWAHDKTLRTSEGRRGREDEIDADLGGWCSAHSGDEVVDALWARGVPVAKVMPADATDSLAHHQARGLFEAVGHPLVGRELHIGYPARLSGGPSSLHRSPAPTLGQDNEAVLGGIVGLSQTELDVLERDAIIGTRLVGEHRTR